MDTERTGVADIVIIFIMCILAMLSGCSPSPWNSILTDAVIVFTSIFVLGNFTVYLKWRNDLILGIRQRAIEFIFDQPCATDSAISVQSQLLEVYNREGYVAQVFKFYKWKYEHFYPNFLELEKQNGLPSDKRKADESQQGLS